MHIQARRTGDDGRTPPAQGAPPAAPRSVAQPAANTASRLPAGFLRRGFGWIRYLGLVLLWGLGCSGWSLAAPLVARLLPRRRRAGFGRAGIHHGFRIMLRLMQASGLCRFELDALDGLRGAGPLVVAANHPSLIDAVLLAARLPRAVCICKATLWNNIFLGGGIRLAGYLRNDAPLPLVRAGIATLREGDQLVVFPEGTRTLPGQRRLRFHPGFAAMAQAAGVPVQTVIIESTPFLNRDWPLFRLPPLPIVCSVRLGRRLAVSGPTRPFVEQLERYFEAELAGKPAPEFTPNTTPDSKLDGLDRSGQAPA